MKTPCFYSCEVFWIAAEVTEGGNDTHNGRCPVVEDTWIARLNELFPFQTAGLS